MFPSLNFPSYCLASYSGMPKPISPPVIPPVAAPMAAPLNAAIIGPAATKGPTPGIARAPIPANQPSAPPTNAPAPAPVEVPSGALLCFSCPISRTPLWSGIKKEISLLRNPATLKESTMRSACDSVGTIHMTAFFITSPLLFVLGSNALLAGDHITVRHLYCENQPVDRTADKGMLWFPLLDAKTGLKIKGSGACCLLFALRRLVFLLGFTPM